MVIVLYVIILFFFFKQKTAYEMRISDWSSDVCSSDLYAADGVALADLNRGNGCEERLRFRGCGFRHVSSPGFPRSNVDQIPVQFPFEFVTVFQGRTEEHTSELQSLMRISYAVFCL